MRKIFIYVVISCLVISNALAEENRTYGPTKTSESLWSIADSMNQASDISTSQIMLAILYKNSHAFSMRNINALEPGNIITYPSLSEINAISKKKAYIEVERQNKAWQNIINKTSISKPNKHKIIKARKIKQFTHKQSKCNSQSIDNAKILTKPKPAPELIATPIIDVAAINTEITKLNEQIKAVVEKNNILQVQLEQINTRVSFVEKSTDKLLRFEIASIFKPLKKYTQADAVVASCVASASLLLLFIIISLLMQLFKKAPVRIDSKEECNFMVSKEDEIAAKLNLVRAYIDMGKNDESRTIINEVIAEGNPIQKAEAQSLLVEIAQN